MEFGFFYRPFDAARNRCSPACEASLKRVMFAVSVASDPAGTVEPSGEHVLKAFRAATSYGRPGCQRCGRCCCLFELGGLLGSSGAGGRRMFGDGPGI